MFSFTCSSVQDYSDLVTVEILRQLIARMIINLHTSTVKFLLPIIIDVHMLHCTAHDQIYPLGGVDHISAGACRNWNGMISRMVPHCTACMGGRSAQQYWSRNHSPLHYDLSATLTDLSGAVLWPQTGPLTCRRHSLIYAAHGRTLQFAALRSQPVTGKSNIILPSLKSWGINY